jgi:hypothetical protein
MKRPRRCSRVVVGKAPTPRKRIMFLAFVFGFAAASCWGQVEVHITPRVAQRSLNG